MFSADRRLASQTTSCFLLLYPPHLEGAPRKKPQTSLILHQTLSCDVYTLKATSAEVYDAEQESLHISVSSLCLYTPAALPPR